MPTQYGFYFDPARCIQCRTCETACKSTHDIKPGLQWRRVIETWDGEYPDVTRTFFSQACLHCAKPACMAVCPTGAISKRAEDGIVIVDADKCNGCRECFSACPFGVPQFGDNGVMQKCDFCIEIAGGPVCGNSCPSEALKYGTLDELLKITKEKKTGTRMEGATGPSIIILK